MAGKASDTRPKKSPAKRRPLDHLSEEERRAIREYRKFHPLSRKDRRRGVA